MKKTISLVLLVTFFVSCKKEKSTDREISIVGNWIPTKTTYVETRYQGSVITRSDTTIFIGQLGEYLNIKSDASFEWNSIESGGTGDNVWYGDTFDKITGSYKTSNGIITFIEGGDEDKFNISELLQDRLELKYEAETVVSVTEKEITKGILEFKK